jgi:hypothetical protein
MSSFEALRKRGDGGIATAFENGSLDTTEGQRHDRISDDGPTVRPDRFAPGRDHNGDIDITAGQKMLSAMSGSLLTSLIGIFNLEI